MKVKGQSLMSHVDLDLAFCVTSRDYILTNHS